MYAWRRGAAGTGAGGRHRPAVACAGRPNPPPDPGPAAGTATDNWRDRRTVPDIADRGDAPSRRPVRGRACYQPQARQAAVALPQCDPAAKTAPAVGRTG